MKNSIAQSAREGMNEMVEGIVLSNAKKKKTFNIINIKEYILDCKNRLSSNYYTRLKISLRTLKMEYSTKKKNSAAVFSSTIYYAVDMR